MFIFLTGPPTHFQAFSKKNIFHFEIWAGVWIWYDYLIQTEFLGLIH